MADAPSTFPSDFQTRKRLRLGTKSCAECRRRKVRCIVQPGANACDGCVSHDVLCQPQEGAPRSKHISREGVRLENGSDQALRERVAHLEDLMVQMVQTQSRATESPTVHTDTTDLVGTLPVSMPNPDSPTDTDIAPASVFAFAGLPNDAQDRSAGEGDADPASAPLVNLLQNYSLVTSVPTPVSQPVQPIHVPRPPLPPLAALTLLLSHTEKYWPVWPTCAFDVARLQQLIMSQHDVNTDAAEGNLPFEDQLIIVKLFLWIALCLTHYPKQLLQGLKLPGTQRNLIEQYTRYASVMLGMQADGRVTMDVMECLSIQWKIYFDTGKPRRAWQTLRRGITAAIELGFHKQDVHKDEVKTKIWTTLWQNERQISCMLGLPSCTSNDHAGTRLADLSSTDAIPTAHHKLSLIAGDIINRDQTSSMDNYTIAIQIDQDLEAVRPLIPAPSAELELTALYNVVVVNMRFYTIQGLLHKPYMLQEPASIQSRYSFDRAVDASRQCIRTLSFFRGVCDDYMCEVLDFQMFTAAMVLIVSILSHRQNSSATVPSLSLPLFDETSDWALIDTSLQCLRRTSDILDCSVAKQGADTLQAFIEVHHPHRAQYPPVASREDLVVTIPYFGRFKIIYPHSVAPVPDSSFGSSSQFPSTDFSTHSTQNAQSFLFPDLSFGEELGVDWYQQSGDTSDLVYDFTKVFSYQ